MTSFDFRGVISALVTPFKKGALDISSYKALIHHQLQNGVQGFVVGGTTGESPTLKLEELKELVLVTRSEVSGQVPVIVGTGKNSTAATQDLTQLAASWGADAALVVVPYYNKPPQRGLIEHFNAIRTTCNIPIILYNVPSRTVASLSFESVVELSKEDRIIGIKEATGDLAFNEQIIAATPQDFLMLSGDDATCVQLALNGGDGVISVISQLIPRALRDLMDRATDGEDKAVTEYKKFGRLMELIYREANPIPVKMALHKMGLIASPELRLPLIKASDELTQDLVAELQRLELMK